MVSEEDGPGISAPWPTAVTVMGEVPAAAAVQAFYRKASAGVERDAQDLIMPASDPRGFL